jgi:MFS transporter, DHA1 family, tetracycline resistance protein
LVQQRKPAAVFIFITLLLDVLGFGLLIPVAPSLIASLLVDPVTGVKGMPVEAAAPYVGWLQATFYACMFLFAPLLGALSDRFGRRPVILFSLFGSGLDYLAMALAPTIGWLFVTRVINGITGASFGVASAYVADVTAPEERHRAYGMIGAAFGIGFVLGPLLGGWLGSIDVHYPFYAAAALTLCNWLYGYFVLPESLPKERRAKFSLAKANPVGMFPMLARYPVILWLAGALFLMNLAQFGLHATWAVYTEHRYKWDELHVGLSLFVVGMGAAVVQGGLARRLIPAMGLRMSLLVGMALGCLAYAAYGMATQGWMIYAIVAVVSLGGIAQPAAQSIVSQTAGASEQGAVQGALQSLNSVAGVLGPIIGSQILDRAIHDRLPGGLGALGVGMHFFVCAIFAAGGLTLAIVATRGMRRDAEGPRAV